MRQSQAEMKAIEAELRSIRADSSVTLLDPNHPRQSPPSSSNSLASISPKIEQRSESPEAKSAAPKKRSIECFPIANITNRSTTQLSHQRLSKPRSDTPRSDTEIPIRGHRSTERQARLAKAAQLNPQQAVARQLLAEKAHQINVLSMQQEAVILELITLSEQLESANAVCETAEVPYVDADDTGTLVLTSRTIEFPLESEPRNRRARTSHLMLASTGVVWQGTWSLLGRLGSFVLAPLGLLLPRPSRAYRGTVHPNGRRASGRRTVDKFTFQEAAILVLGSAMLRVGLDLLVASYPILWIPSLLVMLTPAAIAIYRSTLAPQTGFIWGYRLFSLMIGLLLGGRL